MQRCRGMRTTLLGIALLVGCQTASSSDNPMPTPPMPAPKQPPRLDYQVSVRFHMYRKLDLARAIERALIRGQLDDARALAKNMAEAPDPAGIESWARDAGKVRQQELALANAKSNDDACRRFAQLSAACASCHVESGAFATFVPPPVPPDRGTLADRMAVHAWAADRLWEGLIADVDASWNTGLDMLAQAPFKFSLLEGDRVALAKRLQKVADQGRQRTSTTSPRERADVYGEILVTCSACHSNQPRTDKLEPTAQN